MTASNSRSGGAGLERSCGERSSDWIRQTDVVDGVELLEARLQGRAYRPHRHDTYAISLTDAGVQAFDYRGAAHVSTPGWVVVLHPDEMHDGRAGTDAGFGYRQVYVEPAVIFDAVRVVRGQPCALPFVRNPVVTSPKLATAVAAAFRDQESREPLATDDLVLQLVEGLLEADSRGERTTNMGRLDEAAIERARQFLDAEKTRVVRSWELEAVSGLTRYELARQFRAILGTSPYRYLMMRRLAFARSAISAHRPLADVALDAGFADQAHFTRMFTAAFGITPARYGALRADAGIIDGLRHA